MNDSAVETSSTTEIWILPFIYGILGWNAKHRCRKMFIRTFFPLIFSIIAIIDVSDWIINGESTMNSEGQTATIKQSRIIAILSYTNSQMTFVLTVVLYLTVMSKSAYIQAASTDLKIMNILAVKFNAKSSLYRPKLCFDNIGMGILFVAAILNVTNYIIQVTHVATSEMTFGASSKYFIWTLPYGPLHIVLRGLLMVARVVPFCFYFLYLWMVSKFTTAVKYLNDKLQKSFVNATSDSMSFEKVFANLKFHDSQLAVILANMNEGFSWLIVTTVFGHFLLISSLTAQGFVGALFVNIWDYLRQGIMMAASLGVLLVFLVSGARLHETCKETIDLWQNLVVTRQENREKVSPNSNEDAVLCTYLFRVTQRCHSLTVAGFAHLTRGIGATFLFAYIGYLCFLIERSEYYRTDLKLTGVIKSNLTLLLDNSTDSSL